jgi:hypothetical protein
MPRGLPMVGALVRSTVKKIHIVVAYKCDADGEWIKFGGEGTDQWSRLKDFEIISLREES